MTEAMPQATPSNKSERAAVDAPGVDSRGIIQPWPNCGGSMTGRRLSACSDRGRAARSRRTRPVAQAERDQGVRELLERALAKLTLIRKKSPAKTPTRGRQRRQMYRSEPHLEATDRDLGVRVYRAVLNLTTVAPSAPWRFKNFGLGLNVS